FLIVHYARWWRMRDEMNSQSVSDEESADADSRQTWRRDPSSSASQRGEAAPWAVTQSILERVAALPASAQRLLRVAAVIGQRASCETLAAGAGLSEEEALAGL